MGPMPALEEFQDWLGETGQMIPERVRPVFSQQKCTLNYEELSLGIALTPRLPTRRLNLPHPQNPYVFLLSPGTVTHHMVTHQTRHV